ncbi:unnamed protein product [Symbiodinium sp. CCMP2592]|nr:unnamed protein product [Symbiodinium sp. CCMP2592]
MDDSAGDRAEPAVPLHQQGMSPTLPVLEGEERGPDYHRDDPEHPRMNRDADGQRGSALIPNGVPAGSSPAPPNLPDRRGSQADERPPPRSMNDDHLPTTTRGGGFQAAEEDLNAFMMIDRSPPPITLPVPEPPSTAPREAVMYNASGEPLFPQFLPSPLPGQSPLSDAGSLPARGPSWFSRLGDYIQRRVEVTSWSASQASAGVQQQWPRSSASASANVRQTAPQEPRDASVSSGGVSAEAVQAEVSRQLEVAMGDVLQRLNTERRRTEEARDEARRLRSQLELQESRVMYAEAPRLRPLRDRPQGGEEGAGIQPEVLADLPPQVPQEQRLATGIALPPRAIEPPRDLAEHDGSYDARLRGLDGVPGVDRNVRGAGIQPEVLSDLPPLGSFVDNRPPSRPRSQSPGPRSFLQGLFGLGGGLRDSGPQPYGDSVGCRHSDDHVVPPPPQLPLQPPQLPQPHIPLQPPRVPGDPGRAAGDADGGVLLTLAKGIEALLQQSQSGRGDRPETVKPGISELPLLPEYQPSSGSIDLLSWITHIGPMMEDLSDTSGAWWESTMADVLRWYQQFSSSTPLARLQLRPRPTSPLKAEWARVERRATAMMLSAVPKQVRDEVIASGEVTSLGLLCKLYSVYQPGNLQEKSLVLRMLEQPEECQSALAAVEALRKWSLWRRRAATMGIAEPDASILLRGLDRITGPVVRGSGELAFRVSLIRSTLQLDVCPSSQSITTFTQHLQAEMEQQARLGAARPASDQATSLKALGRECKYPHTWNLLDKVSRQKKCLNCGAQGHKAKECRAPGGGAATPKGAPKGGSVGASDTGATSSSTPTSETSRRVNFETGDIQAKVMKVLEGLQEISVFKPGEWYQARSVGVQLAGDSVALMKQNESGTLLSTDDMAQVIVPLGKVIATLGYRLSWNANVCELVGPTGDVIPLTVRNGCPEVSEGVAHRLIQKLEEQQLPQLEQATQASVKAISQLKASWWSYLRNYVKGGNALDARAAVDKAVFLDYKDVIKDQLIVKPPKQGIWDLLMKGLRINRRGRKKLFRSRSWIVRWDSPASERPRDPLKHLSFVDCAVYVNMSTLLAESDFDDVWKVIQWAALDGRISTVVAKDAATKHPEQVVAGPHRSKVHFLHALASVARECHGDGPVRFYVEDLRRAASTPASQEEPASTTWLPWTRCKDSRAYLEEMGMLDVSVDHYDGLRCVRMAKMSSDAAWRLHVARNHQPFRRDCSVCVRNSAAGHQHRSTLHPMAYSLSVDVVGPLKGFGRSPDGKFFKYFVIGAFRIPEVEGAEGHGEVRGHPLPPLDAEDEEETIECDDPLDDDAVPEGAGVGLDEVEKEEQTWKELLATFKEPIATTTLYFAVPVNNKKAATMLPAVQRIVTEVKALGYPVTRLHSDRGGEFRGNLVRKWALSQGMWPTTTTGSDSAANGVAEAGVRYLKRRARVLLDAGGVSKENWPTAIQYAAAQQRSERLGSLPVMPVAYGTKVYVKTKRYKTGAVEDFGPHWTKGRYVGPSTDIRGGHVILKDSGTFIQTTHVRVTRDPPTVDDVAPTVLVEPEESDGPADGEPPLPPPALPPPARRMRAKAPMVSKMDTFYQPLEVLSDVLPSSVEDDCPDGSVKYLRAGEIDYVETVAEQMFRNDCFSEKECARLLALFAGTCGNLKVPRAPEGQGMILGAFVHGGSFGVTRYGRDLPWVTRYFNSYLRAKIDKHWPGLHTTWTTIALQSAEQIPKHKDSHNERNTYNYVLELKTRSLDGLWVENQGMERRVVGGANAKDYQYVDQHGQAHEGCLVDVTKKPAVFDPHVPHAYVTEGNRKWFLSAYTPQGAYKLNANDQKYLAALNFPLAHVDDEGDDDSVGNSLETRPMMRAASLPSATLLGGAHDEVGEVDAVTTGDCEATMWDWALYAEEPVEEEGVDGEVSAKACLKRLCSSEDPGAELPGLTLIPEIFNEGEGDFEYKADMERSVEYWASLGLYDVPRVAKLEPEYVEDIEGIIQTAIDNKIPLRHTYNVSPQEAKAVIAKWRPAISKELGVVEKGFERVTTSEVSELKKKFVVQELPSKLVYTVKPPAAESAEEEGESALCKRKARIVCCGNYAAEDQNELYAGGAAAESLRCALTYSARRRWRSGITDISGAFMLTPLPRGERETVYIIRPPAALIQLGLAQPTERWLLTHGMYGLRQSPKLWASYRDDYIAGVEVEHEGKTWSLKQGKAEPNLWMVYEVGAPECDPTGLVLLYVDDILLAGPLWLVTALAATISAKWKTSELDLLSFDHDIRFLGCEIATNEEFSAIYLHQRPYIEEILRHHGTEQTEQSPIQAPKEWVTFEAFEGEDRGSDDEVKQAQKACGELLWIAQRSRPDISFVVCAMGSLLTRAAPRCLRIAARLRSYLQRTKHLALSLRPTTSDFAVYTDSSFAPEGSRSHSGMVAVWMGAPICWRSARQPFVCLSTAECELLAATEGLVIGKSIAAVVREMHKDLGHISLRIDNQAAITLAKPSSSTSWRTRHLRVRAAYIHEQILTDQVSVVYVPGSNQWADLLTKSFPRQRLEELVGIWGFVDLVTEVSKLALVRMMVLCMMVQTARASSIEPLALDSSFELYAAIAVAGMALVGLWEAFWYVWERCCGDPGESRSSKRHRRLQEAVQRELAAKLAEMETTDPPPPKRATSEWMGAPSSTSSSSTSTVVRRGRSALSRRSLDVGVQTDPLPPPRGQVEVREVMVPQWHEGPVYVSGNGDHFHTRQEHFRGRLIQAVNEQAKAASM